MKNYFPDWSCTIKDLKKRLYRKFVPEKLRSLVWIARRYTGTKLIPGLTFNQDGFSTSHFLGFRQDSKFNSAFSSAVSSMPQNLAGHMTTIEWRAHICTWSANQALKLEGDFVECGVWHGTLSKTICEYADFKSNNRKFYLVDTWGGSPENHPNYQVDIFDQVKTRFSMYPSVQLVRGSVPTILEQIPSSQIAYLSLDMNGSLPELAALNFFYPKMVRGGVIYFDDYGWNYPELRKVVDEFFSDKPETLLHFPSGNSLVIKT